MIKWPKEIINAIARRRVTLVLGAGVSRNSSNAAGLRPPLWTEFLEHGIAECPAPHKEMKKLLARDDLLGCCQLVKVRLDQEWVPFVEKEFRHPNFGHHDIHRYIFDLDSNIVITPNFDRIYDNFAVSKAGHNVRIKKYYEDDLGRAIRGTENERLILKIHGCIDAPDRLIFSREDYADARSKHARFYQALEALFITNTVVFLGCGLSDPDINLILEQYARSFTNSPPHYFVTASQYSQEYAKMLKGNYNVALVRYSPKDNHQELTASISELVKLVDAKRLDLAGTMLW